MVETAVVTSEPAFRSARVGSPAPQFECLTTMGLMKLEDFKGRWLILFSHPGNFTPVCATEFLAFAQIYDKLRQMHCELLGLSIESIYSHIAWIRNLEEKFNQKIKFPLIADPGREVAQKYGMLSSESNTEASRSLFIIDDRQTVRAAFHYPSCVGRGVDEVVRVLQGLQAADKHSIATPANWKPGDQVLIPPPRTQAHAEERFHERGVECRDWYFCGKPMRVG